MNSTTIAVDVAKLVLLRPALADAVQEIGELEARIRTVERQLETAAAESLVVGQLRTIPGIGLLTATALVATFPSGRHFATISVSRRANIRRGRAGTSASSVSGATATCACS